MKKIIRNSSKYVSNMLMLNLGVFLAWGLYCSLFTYPGGWFENDYLSFSSPIIINILLPILIANQGGKLKGGPRGAIIASVAILGSIAFDIGQFYYPVDFLNDDPFIWNYSGDFGTGIRMPMIVVALIVGPVVGLFVNKMDEHKRKHLPKKYLMMFDYFSVGIVGVLFSTITYLFTYTFVDSVVDGLASLIKQLIENDLVCVSTLIFEPLKLAFMGEGVNNNIFLSMGAEEVKNTGSSILYMICSNPGPGIGVILAYLMFTKDKLVKASTPAALVIHAFGGIHEIYFPYVLSNPLMIIAPVCGIFSSVLWLVVMGAGACVPIVPGSIIKYILAVPESQIWIVIIAVLIGALISFVIAVPFIKIAEDKSLEIVGIEEAKYQETQAIEYQKKKEQKIYDIVKNSSLKELDINPYVIKRIAFVCTTGIGFSTMGATAFRNKLSNKRPDIIIDNYAVDNISKDVDLIISQKGIIESFKDKDFHHAPIVYVDNFVDDQALNVLFQILTSVSIDEIKSWKEKIIIRFTEDGILLGQAASDKYDAITDAGMMLKKLGLVDSEYVLSMQSRERESSTYVDNGVVLAHGYRDKNSSNIAPGIVLVQYPEGVPFDDKTAYLVFGISGRGDRYMDILSNIASSLNDEDVLNTLKTTNDKSKIIEILNK